MAEAAVGQRLPKKIGVHQKAQQAALQEVLLDPAEVPDAAESHVPLENKERQILCLRRHHPRHYIHCQGSLR